LSYTWGPPTSLKTILVDGKLFQVRENLYEFLKIATYTYRVYLFWIDQISINQENTDEVNAQLSIMANIYRNAYAVIAWVGVSGPDVEMLTKENVELLQYERQTVRFDAMARLQTFLNRSYWSRIWIIQELSVNRTVLFHSGNMQFQWVTLEGILQFREVDWWNNRFWMPLWMQRCIQENDKEREKTKLHDAITIFYISENHGWQSSKIHDRIYGLMPLLPEDQQLQVDYRKSTETLFEEVIALAIKHYLELSKQWFQSPRPTVWEDEKIDEGTLASSVSRIDAIAMYTCRALELPQKDSGYALAIWKDKYRDFGLSRQEEFQTHYERSVKFQKIRPR
jgi:hypothetical protein